MSIAQLDMPISVSASALSLADDETSRPMHRIAEIRRQQGISLRTVARRMNTTAQAARQQERNDSDLKLSELYAWQCALEVPVADLLVDLDAPLSMPVLQRARLLKMMKTALAIIEASDDESVVRMAQTLADQLVEVMPELRDVNPWHSVGQRRTLDEMGRIAQETVPERVFFEYAG